MIPQEIYQSVHKQVKEHHWRGKKIIAAVSGGIDSMALCIVLQHLDIPFIIAHCNFQLRGEDSFGDEKHVVNWGKAHQIPVYVQRFDTPALLNKGGNLQALCRQLRYDWFETLRETLGYDFIATAHHQQDLVETVLMNLLKGTGIAGLHGIATQNGHIIRPLLSIQKASLQNILLSSNTEWREDSSNAKDDYVRNKIRHHVLPVLTSVQPQAVQNIYNTSKRIREAEQYMAYNMQKDIEKLTEARNKDIYIAIKKLIKIPGYESLLYTIAQNYGFSAAQTEDCLHLLNAHSGKFVSNTSYKMIKNRDFLIITPNDTAESTHILIDKLEDLQSIPYYTFCLHANWSTTPLANSSTSQDCFMRPDTLQFPLCLRPYKEGDYLYPFGMQMKKKKISKLLKDLKIPLHEKENVWVLQNGDDKIIWVIGIRTDQRFCIQDPAAGYWHIINASL